MSTMHMCYLCNRKGKDTNQGVCSVFLVLLFRNRGFSLGHQVSLSAWQAQGLGAQLLKSAVGWSKVTHEAVSMVSRTDHLCSGFNSSLFFFFLGLVMS